MTGTSEVTVSPLVVSLVVVAVLLFVIIATGWALYGEERKYREERRQTEAIRSEANRLQNRTEIESDYE